jgi:hypothetical protein
MPDVDDRSLPGGVQVPLAVNGGNPAAFAPHGHRIVLLEVTRKKR